MNPLVKFLDDRGISTSELVRLAEVVRNEPSEASHRAYDLEFDRVVTVDLWREFASLTAEKDYRLV
jgi:hypothetical protein